MINVPRALDNAATWLEEHDFYQSYYGPDEWRPASLEALESPPDRACLIGAIAIANRFVERDFRLCVCMVFVCNALRLRTPEILDLPPDHCEQWEMCLPLLSEWNDDTARTKADVVNALRRAAGTRFAED